MSVSAEEVAFAKDLFAGLGTITSRKMMGGLCLYAEGTLFAILHPEHGLMLKGGGGFGAQLEALGGQQWTYRRAGQKAAGKEIKMPYWSLPEEAQDDPDAATALAREALRFL